MSHSALGPKPQRRENEVSPGGTFPPPRPVLLVGNYGERSVIQGTPSASHILSLACSTPLSLQWFKATWFHSSSKESPGVCQLSPCDTLVQGHLTVILNYSNMLYCLSHPGPMNPELSFIQWLNFTRREIVSACLPAFPSAFSVPQPGTSLGHSPACWKALD